MPDHSRGRHGRRCLVRLLFDDLRTKALVDPPLDRRATVVGLVNRAGQLHKSSAEIARALASADLILDIAITTR